MDSNLVHDGRFNFLYLFPFRVAISQVFTKGTAGFRGCVSLDRQFPLGISDVEQGWEIRMLEIVSLLGEGLLQSFEP